MFPQGHQGRPPYSPNSQSFASQSPTNRPQYQSSTNRQYQYRPRPQNGHFGYSQSYVPAQARPSQGGYGGYAYGHHQQQQQQQYVPYLPPQYSSQQSYRPRQQRRQQRPPEPEMTTAELKGPFFSIDVECVATGPQHTARAVAHIAMVDGDEKVVLNVYVKPDVAVFSYLEPLTALNADLVQQGVTLQKAIEQVKQALPSHATLVGQNILKDVQWLSLEEGKDFAGMLDLAGLWRVHNPQYGNYTMHSLHHKAKALLGHDQGDAPHTADMDAILSIRLFRLHQQLERAPQGLPQARQRLLQVPIDPHFNKKHPVWEGACLGVRKLCTCGAPFFY